MTQGFRIRKRDADRSRVLSVVLTLIVIGTLLFSMPVKALELSLSSPSDSTPTQGDIITFSANVTISDSEIVPFESMKIVFKDSSGNYENCTFNLSNASSTTCSFLDVTSSEEDTAYGYGYGSAEFNSTDYYWGYGYGYGYAHSPGLGDAIYSYEFSLNTSGLDVDEYEVWLVAVTEETNTSVTEFPSSSFELTVEEAETESSTTSNRRESPCFTSWVCSEWGECAEGTQSRTCRKEISHCVAKEDMPATAQNCTEDKASEESKDGSAKGSATPGEQTQTGEGETQGKEGQETQTKEPTSDTTPVAQTKMGALNTAFLALVLIALVIVIIAIAIFTRHKKN